MRGVYIASQLSVGRVGHRHLMTKITFDKGGVWQQIAAPKVDNNGKLLNCSLVSPKVIIIIVIIIIIIVVVIIIIIITTIIIIIISYCKA